MTVQPCYFSVLIKILVMIKKKKKSHLNLIDSLGIKFSWNYFEEHSSQTCSAQDPHLKLASFPWPRLLKIHNV